MTRHQCSECLKQREVLKLLIMEHNLLVKVEVERLMYRARSLPFKPELADAQFFFCRQLSRHGLLCRVDGVEIQNTAAAVQRDGCARSFTGFLLFLCDHRSKGRAERIDLL